MDNLQWFKFSPSDWMMGRIQRQPAQVQVDFIRLCCKYWQKDCELLAEDAELEAMESYSVLVKYRFIIIDGDSVRISFLDEQFTTASSKRQKASDAGKRSAEVRRRSTDVQQTFNDASTDVEQSRVEESRVDEDKIRVKKERSIPPPPPSIDEVIAYFKENKYTEQSAIKAFGYYQASVTETKKHWSDGKGNPIKNWKMKMQSVWFKDENKETEKPAFEDRNNQRGNIRFASPIL